MPRWLPKWRKAHTSRLRRRVVGRPGPWLEELEVRQVLSANFLTGQNIGAIQQAAITEASGLVASRTFADVFWTHNDSGDTARVFAMNAQGQHLGIYNLTGTANVDYEDIAIGPGPASGVDYLYVGDIGDNGHARSSIQVYRVAEPTVSSTQSPVTVNLSGSQTITLVYPDGQRDAEALLVDPMNGDLYVITKDAPASRIYRAAYPQATSGTATLQFMGTLPYSGVTGGDISPNGQEILVRTHDTVRLYQRPVGGNLWDALAGTAQVLPYTVETQGEAITFDRSGLDYYTTSEGAAAPVYRYQRVGEGDGSVRFAVIGDFGVDNANEAAVANLVSGWNPDLVTTVGDNNYTLGGADTIDANIGKYYHQFIGNYVGFYGAGSATNRFYPALGNHDWETTNAQPYLDYFTLLGNERFYDFVAGAVHFFVIDSDSREPDGIGANSAQATWLRNEMAESTAPFQIVLLHHAPYSSSSSHGSNLTLEWPFEQWGADAVLAGHDHDYERLDVGGIPYFVDGLGGNSTYAFGTPLPESVVRYVDNFGAMLVTADNSSMVFQFYNVAGSLIDSYTVDRPTTLSQTLLPANSTWKYKDNGTDQGTAWRANGFDDSAWAAGNGQLGYGDGDETTTVSYGSNSSNKYITTYVRKTFSVADPNQVLGLTLDLLRDDGAVVYLNGTEVARSNLPTGTITYTTLAPSAIGGSGENQFVTFSISPSLLVSGTNTLAVEMHQNAVTSSDISFDAWLTARVNTPPNNVNAGGPYSIAEGASLSLAASASDPDSGQGISYSWDINGDAVFGDASGAAPSLTWAQLVALGVADGPSTRSIWVRATDSLGGSTIAPPATLTITNTAPSAALSGPLFVLSGQATSFTFIASDPSPLDQAGSFTYDIDWNGDGTFDQSQSGGSTLNVSHTFAAAGVHPVKVRATDAQGATGATSAPTTVTVFNSSSTVSQVGPSVGLVGTATDDLFYVLVMGSTGSVAVNVNNVSQGYWNLGAGGSIAIFGLNGNDVLAIGGSNTSNSFLVGATSATVNTVPFANDSIERYGLQGGTANDVFTITGGTGFVIGDTGTDTLTGPAGDHRWNIQGNDLGDIDGNFWTFNQVENLTGGAGNDTFAFYGTNQVAGTVNGGSGVNTLNYENVSGGISVNLQSGLASRALSVTSVQNVTGGPGNDTITGDGNANVLQGNGGADTVDGAGGDDFVLGGNWVYSASDGNDVLYGGLGADTELGGAGDDEIHGGDSGDLLVGGYWDVNAAGGNNTIFGDNGDDQIQAGSGNDTVSGGQGNDTILGAYWDFSGPDGNDLLSGDDGDDMILGGKGADIIDGGPGNDRLFGGHFTGPLAGDGDDIVLGRAGADLVDGGNGRDFLIGGQDIDNIYGEAGDDLIVSGEVSFAGSTSSLNAVQAEWTSGHSYPDRVTYLSGTPGGANGGTYLNASTVLADSAVDTVFGNSEYDWFVVDIADSIGDQGFPGTETRTNL